MAKPISPRQLTCLQALLARRMRPAGFDAAEAREARHAYVHAATNGRASSAKELCFADARRLIAALIAEQAGASISQIADAAAARAAGTHGRRRHHDGRSDVMVGAQQRQLIDALAARLGWDAVRLDGFVGRQLGAGRGAASIRTMAEANRVIWPMKRMARTTGEARRPSFASPDRSPVHGVSTDLKDLPPASQPTYEAPPL